jgi:hypothetical protein
MTDYERELLQTNPREWAYLMGMKAKDYLEDNYEIAKYVLPFVTAAGMAVIKMAKKEQRRRHEQDDRDRRLYDPSARHWWYFKRRATPWEWNEIDRRHRNGEPYYQILRSMNLVN